MIQAIIEPHSTEDQDSDELVCDCGEKQFFVYKDLLFECADCGRFHYFYTETLH